MCKALSILFYCFLLCEVAILFAELLLWIPVVFRLKVWVMLFLLCDSSLKLANMGGLFCSLFEQMYSNTCQNGLKSSLALVFPIWLCFSSWGSLRFQLPRLLLSELKLYSGKTVIWPCHRHFLCRKVFYVELNWDTSLWGWNILLSAYLKLKFFSYFGFKAFPITVNWASLFMRGETFLEDL